jgi:beta-galactosidase/beta-glucuronidase
VYEELIVDYVWVRLRSLTKEEAVLSFVIAFRGNSGNVSEMFSFQLSDNETVFVTQKVTALHHYVEIQIKEPKLWWPNGIG